MAVIIDEKKGRPLQTMTLEQRDEMILNLEMQRDQLTEKIEAVMTAYSKVAKKKSLRSRGSKVVKTANIRKK